MTVRTVEALADRATEEPWSSLASLTPRLATQHCAWCGTPRREPWRDPSDNGRQTVLELASDRQIGSVGGQVCGMLAVDIRGFTRPERDEEVRIHLHKVLYEILPEALQGAGIPWSRCYHEDRGDGALIVLPPDMTAHGIVDPFPERLRCLIRRHNRMSCEAARMQLRVAAHIGPVYRDDYGLVGDDVNLLFRMLDARPLRRALDDYGTEVALIISSYLHDSLVRRHPALADPDLYQPLKTQVRRMRLSAWMHLPGASPQLAMVKLEVTHLDVPSYTLKCGSLPSS
jgi:class 3 adenylate cyclase